MLPIARAMADASDKPTTPEEIEHAATVVPGVVARLRAS